MLNVDKGSQGGQAGRKAYKNARQDRTRIEPQKRESDLKPVGTTQNKKAPCTADQANTESDHIKGRGYCTTGKGK